MEDHDLTSDQMAERMGVDAHVVANLTSGGLATIDEETAQQLEKATGVEADFWHRVEARYKKDVIRLTPKRVGLFDSLDSFTRVRGKRAELFRDAVVRGLMEEGDGPEQRIAEVLKNSNEFSILVEFYEDVVHFEVTVGARDEAHVALGPDLLAIVTDSAPQTAPVRVASKTVYEHPSYLRDYVRAWFPNKIALQTPDDVVTVWHEPGVYA